MPEEDVLAHIRSLEDAGFQEVVLSGIHLGAYGSDRSRESSLLALLDRIEHDTKIPRVRLSSIEPGELTPEIRQLAASSSRICPHFHVPLQSGDDDLLKKMGRPYSAASFESLVLDLRRRMPDAAIGADVLVGFPGETERSFDRTRRLVERLPLTYLHVFPFSPRPGTPAFHFSGKISAAVIRKRGQKLRNIGNQKRAAFLDSLRNQVLSVLVEARRDPETGLLKGITGNYAAVLLEGPDSLKNRIVSCCIGKKAGGSAVFGRVRSPEKAPG
jgi:threonylcarbamoyladenosine tRNA methylthiotransferase MtaB